MYTLSEKEIEYILADLESRGIVMESLRLDLLDHVCCIMEQELKAGDDFRQFYQRVIPLFYRTELAEIEKETMDLLTYKNYYGMKKLMMVSGAFTVFAFITGSFFKVMYWPGANVSLVSATLVFCFVFLPVLYVLKLKEVKMSRDRGLMALGTLTGVLYCLSALFRVQHWQGTNIIWFSTLIIAFFILLPWYFFTGIRKPETKLNTIVTSVIFMAVLGVHFLITSVRPHPKLEENKAVSSQADKLPAVKVSHNEVVY